MFICFSFEATFYKADQKMAEEDFLEGESRTRQMEIVVEER